jgi:predicted GNAT family N-acyltransferase
MTDEKKPHVEVRQACTEEERRRIYRFRYQVYVDEMGKRPGYADHERRELYDALDDWAVLLYAQADGEVIATLRLNQASDREFPEYWRRIYQLSRFSRFPAASLSMSSRLMVARAWRGSTALGGLLVAIYELARKRGVQFDFCNCSPALVEFYEQLGYQRFGDGFMDEDAGYHVPMVLVAEDVAHLRRVRSPFLRLARRMENSDETARWFAAEFQHVGGHVNKRLVTADEFWSILSERLHAAPVQGIPLLDGLDEDEARRFLDTGTVLHLKAGDTLIRTGDVGDEMFVILSGVAEVIGRSGGRSHSLAVLGVGQIIGEIAFVSHRPRSADVVASTDMQVLILTQAFLKRALRKMPDITARVLLNLSLILAQRLRQSTRNWMDALEDSNED